VIYLIRRLPWKKLMARLRWLYEAMRGYKRGALLLTGLMTASAIIGVLTALLLRSLIDTASGLTGGPLVQTGLFFMLALIIQAGISALLPVLGARIRTGHVNALREKLFDSFMAVNWQQLISHHSGDYVNRMISDAEDVSWFLLTAVPDLIATFAQLVAAGVVLFFMEPVLALIMLAVTPVLSVLARAFARPMNEASMKMRELYGESIALTQESIQNIVTLRAFQRQAAAGEKLHRLHSSLMHWTVRQGKLSALSGAAQGAGFFIAYALAMMWGVWKLSQKALSFGGLAAYLQLASQVQSPLRHLAGQFPQMVSAMVSAGRLMEVLSLPAENLSGEAPALCGPLGIKLKSVRFAYKEGDGEGKAMLDGLSMTVPFGTMAALIGATGEGKTTVARLLLGLVNAQEGGVLLYGPDGREYPAGAAARGAFSYVPQGRFLFSGTIADNLRLGREAATPEEMEEALRLSCAWDFVNALPDRLDTCLGENGIGLSEGQHQRIAIARALLRDAPILILDEATSALDMRTESVMLKNIRDAFQSKGRTALIITHRSAALKNCSAVYRLSGGKAYAVPQAVKVTHTRPRIKKAAAS
jgi:ABC-type multidrug transport system fused ATPase/permease subunit